MIYRIRDFQSRILPANRILFVQMCSGCSLNVTTRLCEIQR